MECDPGELTEPALEYAVSLPLPGDERERWRSRCLHIRSCHSIVGGGSTILLSAKIPVASTSCRGGYGGSTHLRLKRTRASLVTVAEQTESFPWEIFPRAYEIRDRQDPMMSSIQPTGGEQRKKPVRRTNLPASTRFRIALASSSCPRSEMRLAARGSLVCMMTPIRASKCCMRCSIALM